MISNYKVLVPVAFVLVSCHVTKKYQQSLKPSPALYRDISSSDSTSGGEIPWKAFFTDTTLQSLIQEGINQNTDVKIAFQRIVASKATFTKSKSAFLPDINGTAGIKQSRLAFPQGFGLITNATQFDLGVSTSWEADFWGKLRSSKRAAFAELLGTQAALRVIQTQLVADIALHYISLLALDEQLDMLHQTAANRQEEFITMQALNQSNVVNGAAVVQSEANKYAAEVAIPDVKRQIRETENALSLLLNRNPGAIKRGKMSEFELQTNIQTGVPARLLSNRPDLQKAEMTLKAAFENINVARSYFYPSFKITGAAGFSSFDFSKWFTSAGFFANIAGGVTQPIFNKRENKTRLTIAETEKEQALLAFQKVIQTAGQEVSDAVYLIETAESKQVVRTKQLSSLEKAVDFTKELMRYNSSTNYTDVLTSEQSLLATKTELISDKLQKWQGAIHLYRALGGGWK